MTNGPNRILDDLARLLTDAAGAAQGVRTEIENAIRNQTERILNSMDLVRREEFEAVREIAVKARTENEDLRHRIEKLENKRPGSGRTKAAAAKKTPAAKKQTKKS